MRRAAWLLLSELAGLPLLVTAFAIVSDGARRTSQERAHAVGASRRGTVHAAHKLQAGAGLAAATWVPQTPWGKSLTRANQSASTAEFEADAQPADDLEEDATSLFFVHRLMPIGVNDTMADCGGPHQPPCTLFMRYFTWNFTMQMGWSIVTWILMGLTVVSFCACCCVSKR
mmetsp:Transcript_22723/g.59258  ORF Transcript_22723/g.59258 Transcript_22723/m.59258 type:complete len:172 (+) Transcript_22723:111-626(+)